ncbi:MAG: hypothetical protein WC683_02750 [bacterium]
MDKTTFHSESGVTATGAQVEIGFVEHNGTQFSSIGPVVDHTQGVVIGHVCEEGGRFVLKNWAGDKIIAPLALTGRYRIHPPGAYCPVVVQCFATMIDGRRYSGRKSAGWTLLRLRAHVGQGEGSK